MIVGMDYCPTDYSLRTVRVIHSQLFDRSEALVAVEPEEMDECIARWNERGWSAQRLGPDRVWMTK